jgi:subtilisin family serine protease
MKRAFVAGLAAVGLTACQDSPTTGPIAPSAGPSLSEAPASRGGPPEYVPGEVIVKFRAGASEESRGAAMRAANAAIGERIRTAAMARRGDDEGITVVRSGRPTPEAIAALQQSDAVEYAEPNWVYQHTATSTDTYFANGSLWGMYGDASTPANQFGSQAAEAWAAGHTGSTSVYIGIIDEGFQNTHPDLDANSWTNPYDKIDGVDNDGNGYVDDINGWDFDGNNNTIYDGGTRGSLDDHGTHVAGTIGGESNGAGVAGVNWNVTMISGKFLGRRGGTTTAAIKAVDYFTDLKKRHRLNVVATNNSWGGGGYSQALYDAVSRANDAGILFIAAAGNGGSDQVGDNNDNVASYPSNYDLPNVIAVAAITSSGALSSFSNYGAKTVDIGAPGSGVWSSTAFNTYSAYSGTSMATPHVTGGAALYASTRSGVTAAQIKAAILGSAVPTASLAGKSVTGGRLNVSSF